MLCGAVIFPILLDTQQVQAAERRASLTGRSIMAALPPDLINHNPAIGEDASGRGQSGGQSALMPPLPLASCGPNQRVRQAVIIVDGSVSMGLPTSIVLAVEDELDRKVAADDQSAWVEYRAWLRKPTLKRLDVAKQGVGTAAHTAPLDMRIGMVTFRSCQMVETLPLVSAPLRSALGATVNDIHVRSGGETPIAESLRQAGGLLKDELGRIVIITDGKDSCGGDVCREAVRLKSKLPGVAVDVLDISGRSELACIASATGGALLTFPKLSDPATLRSGVLRVLSSCPSS